MIHLDFDDDGVPVLAICAQPPSVATPIQPDDIDLGGNEPLWKSDGEPTRDPLPTSALEAADDCA